jgi:hypothetical protein
MQDPNTLPSREELLATVDKLNYHQRIHYAAQLGKTHKNSPKLKELIDNLRKVLQCAKYEFNLRVNYQSFLKTNLKKFKI